LAWLIVLMVATLTAGDVLGLEMSLAPGLSVKNAFLYLIAFALVFRRALSGGGERVPFVSVHLAFFLLVGYATLSWLVTALIVKYPGYQPLEGALSLKARMFDPALMLFAALYGLKDIKDVWLLLKCLLGAIALANMATLLDVAGLVHIGMRVGDTGGEEGRVFGAFGHANDTGALIVCTLPGLLALTVTSHGLRRLLWLAGVLASVMVLLMTVSRGAFVGLAVGGVFAAIICRRYVPIERFVMLWIGLAVVALLGALIASLMDPQIASVLSERLLGTSRSIDMTEASSGRTAIWAEALERMLQTPSSFLIGLGWNSYYVMPFRYAPHNYYLGLGFDLGIFAVGLVVFILARCVLEAFRAVERAPAELRAQLLAFVFGIFCLGITIIFADLFKPWAYIWLYVGTILKGASLVHEGLARSVVPKAAPEQPIVRGVPIHFGDTVVRPGRFVTRVRS
jgi:O-antigen ligase